MPTFRWDRDEIETRILERADMVGSSFVSAAELERVANTAFTEFYLKYVSQFEDLCVVMAGEEDDTTASTTLFDLPGALIKLKGLRHTTGEFLIPVNNVMEIDAFTSDGYRARPTHYWMAGVTGVVGTPAQVLLLPNPDAAYSITCYYVPNITLDSIEGDSAFALNLAYGCDEYVVLTAAMKLKDKEESDCSVIMAERKMLWESIEKFLTPLDESMPKQVSRHVFRGARLGGDPYEAEMDFG
jgi:hypothetical protein